MLAQIIKESTYHFQPSWVMVIIILLIMIIGYLFSAFHARFIAIIKAFFTIRFSDQFSRDEYSLSHPASIFLSLNFLIACSLFILQAVSSTQIFSSFLWLSFPSFLLIVGAVFAVYLVKILLLKIIGFIFDKQLIVNEYIFIVVLVNQIIGIGLIPVIIFIAYGEQTFLTEYIYTGIILFVLSFLIRVGKGSITILSGGEIALFYLFVYLCTLEILPLLLGWKLIEKIL